MNRPFPAAIPGFTRAILPILRKEIRGNRIIGDVKAIAGTDRWNSFDRFHDTSDILVRAYEEAGAAAEVAQATTGGAIGSGRWIIHEASDVNAATVDIIKPVKKRILDYSKNPWQVAQWSAATPPDGIRGPIVVIDSREELDKLRRPRALENRIVLTRLDLRTNMKAFASKGAGVVISDIPVRDLPDATRWSKLGWGGLYLEEAALRLVCLVLSENEGAKLRRELQKQGSLILEAKVDIRRYTGTHDIVSGIVRGGENPQDEIWALAHSAEPGAIDNASGVALCIEIARSMETLIAAGRLPRPRRSIRFLNAYECYGFFHYLEHDRRFSTPLAGVNFDTVGSRPDVCDGILSWRATVPMSAGFVDDLGATMLRSALKVINPGYRLATGPFVSTSDTLVGDPKYGFPCPWISTHYRKRGRAWAAYHTSADVPALLSQKGLAACALGMAGYLYYLADAGTPELLHLAGKETAKAAGVLKKTKAPSAASIVRQLHKDSLERLTRWTWGDSRASVAHRLDQYRSQVSQAGPRPRASRVKVPPAALQIPRRTRLLSPTLENTPAEIASRIRKSGLRAWALYWANGKRTLAEIADALSFENGSSVSIENVVTFFEAHRDLGYVHLQNPAKDFSRARLVRDFRSLGLRSGMDVVIHSSLSSIGDVRGGAGTVIDALVEAVGSKGTVLFPTFNHGGALVYNQAVTNGRNGAIPNTAWRRPDAVRSDHPTHAVAAIGARAEEYCADHARRGCWTADGPLARLIAADGWVLSLGVGHRATTLMHVAELSVPCGCVDPFGGSYRTLSPDGSVKQVSGPAWRERGCPVPVERVIETLNRGKLQKEGKIGEAPSSLVKARTLYDIRRDHLADVCPGCPIKPEGKGSSQ